MKLLYYYPDSSDFKYEGVSPSGSHKLNTAVVQAYLNKQEGIRCLTTETGAGQWGSAVALACNYFGLQSKTFMVRVSYDQKPYRKFMIETWGGEITPSPSNETRVGRSILEDDPQCPGGLGTSVSEAMEVAIENEDTNYAFGSSLNSVCMHQSIIGLEAQRQFEMVNEYPDVIIGCVGGGSNFSGIILPYVREKMNGKDIKFIAAEPAACPTLTKGRFALDYGDACQLTPLIEMYTIGLTFMPAKIHAGGLRYHGMALALSILYDEGIIDAIAYHQNEIFEAGVLFARTEGIIPAPESSHAIKACIDEAVKAREAGRKKTILFNLSGHGHFDMFSYNCYFAKQLEDYNADKEVEESLSKLPEVTINA